MYISIYLVSTLMVLFAIRNEVSAHECKAPGILVRCTTSCPVTCRDKPIPCSVQCDSEYTCGCPAGYIQMSLDDKECVKEGECPWTCESAQMVFKPCASMCQPTCKNPTPAGCKRGCNSRHCVCPTGMLQPDDDTFTCITSSECPSMELSERCQLPKQVGRCRAWYSRWYFNMRSQRCEMFHYGGCDGNENRFLTKRECETSCQYTGPDVCSLPMKRGPCRMLAVRFYFDSSTKSCKRFGYGGCAGNENKFKTLALCEERCSQTCLLPKKRGPCQYNVRRYFYNHRTGRCRSFVWGGCFPNNNNFGTMSECQNKCAKDPEERVGVWNPFENMEGYRNEGFNAGLTWTE